MKIVYFGTSEFAEVVMKELLKSEHKILALVAQPDRKKGRALKVSPPPAKVLAIEENIPVYQPEDASSRETIDYLKKLDADLFVVVSFGQILRKEVLSVPKFFSINLHSSLLPKYRGAAPINWAIINGDKVSGVTVIRMNEKMDEGDMILKKEINIEPEDTSITLSEKLSELGSCVLLDAMAVIEQEKAIFSKQDDSMVSYAPKLTKEDGLIDWNFPALTIHNRVRGLIPWPGAYTYLDGRILKIWKTSVADIAPENKMENGSVLAISRENGIIIKTGQGSITVKYLQLEGKKILDADAFLRGHKINIGHKFP